MSTNEPNPQESVGEPAEELTLYDRPRCSTCGARKNATVITGPDAADAKNSPCGCIAEVSER